MIVGFYDETEVYAPNPEDKFFERLRETSDTPARPFYMPNGTPFFCTASGILLKNGLADWDKLPESERKPGAVIVPEYRVDTARVKASHRLMKPPPNTLVLQVYRRGLKKDEQGRLYGPKVLPEVYNLPVEPNRDFLWLLEAEWRSLVPDQLVQGRTFHVPDVVRDRICHWHIARGYDSLPEYYTAEDFRTKRMTLTLEEATAEQIRLRLRGYALLKSGACYRFHGELIYHLPAKAFKRFDVIALCDEGQEPAPRPHQNVSFRCYGIALELPDGRSLLLPPFYLRENGGTPEKYFANTRP